MWCETGNEPGHAVYVSTLGDDIITTLPTLRQCELCVSIQIRKGWLCSRAGCVGTLISLGVLSTPGPSHCRSGSGEERRKRIKVNIIVNQTGLFSPSALCRVGKNCSLLSSILCLCLWIKLTQGKFRGIKRHTGLIDGFNFMWKGTTRKRSKNLKKWLESEASILF